MRMGHNRGISETLSLKVCQTIVNICCAKDKVETFNYLMHIIISTVAERNCIIMSLSFEYLGKKVCIAEQTS